MTNEQKVNVTYLSSDLSFRYLDHAAWESVEAARITEQWSGKQTPESRHFEARMLWSDRHLYVHFYARQSGPLIVSDKPVFTKKTMNLWDRDVVELFVAPDRHEPGKYFEFEVAPTGEWLDLAIDVTSGERVTDWDYNSGLEAAARIEDDCVLMAMKIPWEAFGLRPKSGDVWLGNIFRCVGSGEKRGYLAWRPTMTTKPNFHVPERFGEFIFEK